MSHDINEHSNGGYSVTGYILGFILAVILTLLSFIPVMKDMLHDWTVAGKIVYLIGLAIIQILIQSYYFLHLNHGPDSKWNVGTYIFGLVCAVIIIGGTWWAMQHLNYNMMGGSGRIVTPPVIHDVAPQKAVENDTQADPVPVEPIVIIN